MNKKNIAYHIVEMPADRRGMAAFQELKVSRHNMYALLEVDVTIARNFIEEFAKKAGEQLSFTGYLISCLAKAVEADKTVQSYRKGNKQLILFDDVDVGYMVELKKGEKRFLTGRVIQAANRKSFWQIHQEIRMVQASPVLADEESNAWFRKVMQLPWPFSKLFKVFFLALVRNNPTIVTNMAGTVGITSVGMFGKGHSGWGISIGSHSLDLVVGGTARKLAEINGQITSRDMLSLTIIFDHDVIDGAPAARFTKKLVELIESGYGLDEISQIMNANGDQGAAVEDKVESVA
jgi:pyruvate/2-oxoglutarate dehydrogenase complex dihydrolipoamide acyltransferase (E2) component